MGKKLTIEILQKAALQKGGSLLSTEYIGTMFRHQWKCAKGHIWEAVPTHIIKNKTWCPECAKVKKKTIEDCYRLAIVKNGLFLSEKYVNNHTKYKWKCALGHIFEAAYNDVRGKSWCIECRKRTLDELHKAARAKNGFCLSSVYINSHAKYTWQCEKGHTWEATGSKVLNEGSWCAKCVTEKQKMSLVDCKELALKSGGVCLSELYVDAHTKYKWQCEKGHTWEAKYNAIQQGGWCPKCSNMISKPQVEVYEYIKSLEPSAILNDTAIIKPKHLDIYIPSLKLGIEYNGLHWHSSQYKKPKDHYDKAMLCRSNQINLFAFYEDEWSSKQQLIKAMLRWRLKKFNGIKLRASKLTVKKLTKNKDFKAFFERNHLDNSTNASFAYGLFLDDKLIQCISLRTNFKKEFEIARLATDYDYHVFGGVSKLIQAIAKDNPGSKLITFSNNRLSEGSVYANLGAVLLQENQSSYWYTDGVQRFWRFKCKRINDPKILSKYPEVPHTETGQAEGGVFSMEVLGLGGRVPLYKIYDYGHRKWEFDFPA